MIRKKRNKIKMRTKGEHDAYIEGFASAVIKYNEYLTRTDVSEASRSMTDIAKALLASLQKGGDEK